MGLKEKIKEDINNESFNKNRDLLSYAKWVLEELEKESDLKQEMLEIIQRLYNTVCHWEREGHAGERVYVIGLRNANLHDILIQDTYDIIQKAKESL